MNQKIFKDIVIIIKLFIKLFQYINNMCRQRQVVTVTTHCKCINSSCCVLGCEYVNKRQKRIVFPSK